MVAACRPIMWAVASRSCVPILMRAASPRGSTVNGNSLSGLTARSCLPSPRRRLAGRSSLTVRDAAMDDSQVRRYTKKSFTGGLPRPLRDPTASWAEVVWERALQRPPSSAPVSEVDFPTDQDGPVCFLSCIRPAKYRLEERVEIEEAERVVGSTALYQNHFYACADHSNLLSVVPVALDIGLNTCDNCAASVPDGLSAACEVCSTAVCAFCVARVFEHGKCGKCFTLE